MHDDADGRGSDTVAQGHETILSDGLLEAVSHTSVLLDSATWEAAKEANSVFLLYLGNNFLMLSLKARLNAAVGM